MIKIKRISPVLFFPEKIFTMGIFLSYVLDSVGVMASTAADAAGQRTSSGPTRSGEADRKRYNATSALSDQCGDRLLCHRYTILIRVPPDASAQPTRCFPFFRFVLDEAHGFLARAAAIWPDAHALGARYELDAPTLAA